MGGASYFKGVSLERAPTKDINSLKRTKERADIMQEMKDNIGPKTYDAENDFREIGKCF